MSATARRGLCVFGANLDALATGAEAAAVTTSSTKEPHASQAGQRPAQRAVVAPHSLQRWTVRDLAMA